MLISKVTKMLDEKQKSSYNNYVNKALFFIGEAFKTGGKMNIISRILSISLSLSLVFIILELVRRKKLKEKYALLWLITGMAILLLAVFNKLLFLIISLLGIKLPINGILFLGLFFVILINLHFSTVISNLTEQNKKIIQKLALLEIELKNIGKENSLS